MIYNDSPTWIEVNTWESAVARFCKILSTISNTTLWGEEVDPRWSTNSWLKNPVANQFKLLVSMPPIYILGGGDSWISPEVSQRWCQMMHKFQSTNGFAWWLAGGSTYPISCKVHSPQNKGDSTCQKSENENKQ